MTPDQLQLAFEAACIRIWSWDIGADRITIHPPSSAFEDHSSIQFARSRQDWLAAIHPDDRHEVETAVAQALQHGCPLIASFRVPAAEGGWRWTEVRAGVRKDSSGRVVELSGVSQDITARKKTELEIASREETVATLIDTLDGIVWEADAETFQFVFVSRRAERILGFPIEDWLQPGFWAARLHPEDAAWCAEFRRSAARQQRDHNLEFRMIAQDGRVVWIHNLTAVPPGPAPPARVRGVMLDITARKETEQAYRASEELFELLFDQSPAGLVIFDAHGGKVRVNESYCRFLGRTEPEVMRSQLDERVVAEDRELVRQIISELDQGRSVDANLRFLRGDGETVWGRLMARRTSADGRLRQGLSIVEDITPQKRAEALLQQSHENFRTIADDTPAFLSMTDTEGKVTFVNRAAADFLGMDIQTSGFSLFPRVHPDDLDRSRERWEQAVLQRTAVVNESRLRSADGQYRWFLHHYVPRFSEANEFLGHVGLATDITERKVAEQQLQAAHARLAAELCERARLQQELSALSERVITAQEEERRRVARELHDGLGNQIAALTLALSSPGRETGPGETRVLAKMLADMAQITRELSHQLHPVMLEYAGLAAALRELCREFTALTDIKVAVVAPDELGAVPAEVELCAYRVTQEGLQNVAKHSGAKSAVVSLAREAGRLLLTVDDRGVGFNTEDVRRHQGLGLVSIRERVRLLQGSFEIDSTPGCGTTLQVSIPVGT